MWLSIRRIARMFTCDQLEECMFTSDVRLVIVAGEQVSIVQVFLVTEPLSVWSTGLAHAGMQQQSFNTKGYCSCVMDHSVFS